MKRVIVAVLTGLIGVQALPALAQTETGTSDYVMRLSPDRDYAQPGDEALLYGQVLRPNPGNPAPANSALLTPNLPAAMGSAAPANGCVQVGAPNSFAEFRVALANEGEFDLEADVDFFASADCTGSPISADYDSEIHTLAVYYVEAMPDPIYADGISDGDAASAPVAEPVLAEPDPILVGADEEAPMDEDMFVAELTLPETITIPGPTVIMQVTIRGEQAPSSIDDGEQFDTTQFWVDTEESAKVTPIAPDFEMEPKEYECMALDAGGTTATFKLKPIRSGEYEIGADIKLYNSPDCSGVVVNKTIEPLVVLVEVDSAEWTKRFFSDIFQTFTGGFLDFWEMAIAAFFGLLLIAFRKKIMALLGLSKDDVKNAEGE